MSNVLDQLFVYHPAPWIDRDWARISGLPLQEVWFDSTEGARLFGWYVESRETRSGSPFDKLRGLTTGGSAGLTTGVLLWCHGNAGNIIHRLENLVELYRLGLSVFIFDYRGYGRSSGTPSEEGLYDDALAAYAYLIETRHIAPERLVLFGRSLGAAVAGDVASRKPAAGLILESPFPSVGAVARAHYFGLPVDWLLGADFNLTERLRKISVPVLVVHGDRDEVVPIQLGKLVFEAAREPKSFYLVPGADHNDLYQVGGRPYFQRIKQFVGGVIR
ncbi:MAG: alpha/beta hydrolase [Nitrospirae bacterium]|nr:alpha/beta hydrolase [Nitrospirota bacterium]